jgi:transcriptional regulator with XRE-family HTH domain
MLQSRLNQFKLTKKFSNRELASVLQITEQKVGKILSGKYQGSFEEFEYIVHKISETPEEEYYYSTGKHLPQESPTHTPGTQQQMLEVVSRLLEEVRELRQEIKLMREENLSAQVRIPQKVPEHH